MERNRQHHNSRFVRLFKHAFAVFAFGLPIFFIANFSTERFRYFFSSIENIILFLTITFIPIPCILLAAYFYTDLEVERDGLLIDFLWYKLTIPWDKIVQIKPLFGIRNENVAAYVVIVDGLTPFHRLYGLLYGFSVNPAFVLGRTVNDFQILKNDIERHVNKNRKDNP
ncbi:MAG: hypothetical protein HZB50_13135 [Chloroflexi bacterium]|nr:hypothetical protein [Chloroflexota bacterium]